MSQLGFAQGLAAGHLRFRRAAVVLIAVMVIGIIAFTGGPTAQAASGDPGRLPTGADMYSCSDTRCARLASIASGASVPVLCWRDGGPNGSERWFRIRSGGTTGWVPAARMSPQPTVPYCSEMLPGEALYPGQTIWSSNGVYRLVMQGDGNLVEYGSAGARWATMTFGNNWAIMQGDGNLVVYRTGGPALWAAHSMFPGSSVVVQSDGNLVQYAPSYGAVWAASWHQAGGARSGVNAAQADPSQCTYWALEQWKTYTAQHNYPAFKYSSNAGGWVQAINGWPAYQTPMTGSMVVWTGNPGHVGWVVAIRPDGRGGMDILVTERNYDWRGSTRTIWKHADAGLWYIPAPAM